MRVHARVIVVLLVLVGCGVTHVATPGMASASEALTAVAPSVIDIGISNQGLEHNGIGTTRRTDPQLPCFTISGGSGYDTRVLLRFAMPTLPAGSQVTAATMQISLEGWDNRLSLIGSYLTSPWDPQAAQLGWLQRTATESWAAPGAAADALATPTFTLTGFAGNGDTTKTVALDPGIVQGWLDAPATNQGIVLANTASDVIGRIYTSEASAALRPTLTITYEAGAPQCVTAIAGGGFVGTAFAAQSSSFIIEFDATSSQNPIDAVYGLSSGTPAGLSALAAAVRMNAQGTFDARNGGAYEATNLVSYTANTTYRVKLTVDLATHRYAATVRIGTGAEQIVANNFLFHTEQQTATSLDRVNLIVDAATGQAQLCNVTIGPPITPPPPMVSLTSPQSGQTLSGVIPLHATAAAQDGIVHVVFVVDGAPVGAPVTNTPYSMSYDTAALTNASHQFAARATSTSNQMTTSAAVSATVQNGGDPIDPTAYYCGDTNAISEAVGQGVSLPSGHPRILLTPATKARLQERYHSTDESAVRFRDYVQSEFNQNASVPQAYDFQAWYLALAGQLANNVAFLDRAVTYVQSYVDAAVTAINAGTPPPIASDSYLEVGPDIAAIMLTYDWAYDRLTSTQRTQWLWFAEHAVWNVWHHEDATWINQGGPSGQWVNPGTHTWSGWSVDNPSNNYYYSFLKATMLFGMGARGEHPRAAGWLGCFRRTKIQNQLVPVFASDLVGGGSREGTGYGVAHRTLFELYDIYQKSTGENLANLTAHTRSSLAWMIHALTPDQKFIAPLGDHSRDETAAFYDYHRLYVEVLTDLYATDPLAPFGQWIARYPLVSGSRISASQNGPMDFLLYDPTRADAPLSGLHAAYYSSGTGTVFMRAAFAPDATWANFIAGPYTESHAHRDQGSFTIYHRQFLADDQNRFGPSGIEQSEQAHNLVRLAIGGTTQPQRPGRVGQIVALADEPSYAYVASDTAGLYDAGVASLVRREFVFVKPNTFVVYDRVVTPAGTTKYFQLNTGIPPTVNGATATIANNTSSLTLQRLLPADAPIGIVSGSNLGLEQNGPHTGYRLDIQNADATSEFLNVLSVEGAVTSAVSADAVGQRGVRVEFQGGGDAVVRFDTASFGGTIEVRNAAGQPLVNGPLPTSVAAIPLFD